jgi:23S rRNA (guanine745-N1)-methyltransferase
VRGCEHALERDGRAFRCASGHAFDVARAGYVNLLQPQDRRSLAAGDAKETVRARVRLRERGLGTAVDSAIVELLGDRHPDGTVVDLGAGTGDHLARLLGSTHRRGLGFDLSAGAVETAARRHPDAAWCVANCDRALPLRSASVDVVLSIDARRPRDEIARVLCTGGDVLVAVPGAGDLRELRAATLEDARDLPGLARVEAEFAGVFTLVERRRTIEVLELDAAGLADLALATYRNARRREDERLAEIATLSVTIEHEIGLFRASSRAVVESDRSGVPIE